MLNKINKKQPTILIIFGISGDLARRFLLPAIEKIAEADMLPKQFKIVGITRQKNLKIHDLAKNSNKAKKYLQEHTELYHMDVSDSNDYNKLNEHLNKIERKFKGKTQRLFYLSIPPQAGEKIVELIGKSKLIKNNKKQNKLLLEKPFGSDLENAQKLVNHIDKYFKKEQVYRIDHYMAKETAQNIIVFREGNSLFKKTWNKDFIEAIEITASEEIGIEKRANFYEQTGALRDIVQSHLLQLSALVLMALPEGDAVENVPQLRHQALKKLNVVCNIEDGECVKRAQYEGYRKEVNNNKSMTETFVSINLQSSDPRWSGVPITLTTGKALKKKFTEIKIRYKKEKENESNELLLRIQPDAGMAFNVWAKIPGYEHKLSRHALHFNFEEHYGELPEAYEQVLFNAINSDHSLFTSSEEILETWRILDLIQQSWKNSTKDLTIYHKGSEIKEILKK